MVKRQDLVNSDRISELPEALILHILSLLSTKFVVATSVLSKQWQFHWKLMHKLEFNSYDHKGEVGIFSENVSRSLLSNEAPVLESLHLKFNMDNCSVMEFGMLIETANARHVRNLVLDVDSKCRYYMIPKSFYNYETLETLILKACVNVEDSPQVFLKSLKTLHLHFVYIADEAWAIKLLSGCPNLKNLLVHPHLCLRMKTLTISHPSLQRLSIYNRSIRSRKGKWDCVIDAPSLKYVRIEGHHDLVLRMSKNVTKLVEAKIINVDVPHGINEITSVEHLSLSLSPYELIHLELYTNKAVRWNLLTFMLDSSPKLRVLKLINIVSPPHESHERGRWRRYLIADGKWNQPNNVPECLLFHLETFMWTGYNECLVEEEKEAAKYILRNTNSLKRAIFSSKRMSSEDRLELESVVMASNSCQLLFK